MSEAFAPQQLLLRYSTYFHAGKAKIFTSRYARNQALAINIQFLKGGSGIQSS